MENNKRKGNNFFLISFLPALLYWYLEAKYPVRIALAGGIILGLLEIGLEKWYAGHVHQLSKLNFFLIIFLGGFSLMEENGIWFKLQPTLSLWMVAGYMWTRMRRGEGFLKEMMVEMRPLGPRPPDLVLQLMERNLILLFLFYGILMGVLAIWCKTSTWAFFKTAGFFGALTLFMILQSLYNRRLLKRHYFL